MICLPMKVTARWLVNKSESMEGVKLLQVLLNISDGLGQLLPLAILRVLEQVFDALYPSSVRDEYEDKAADATHRPPRFDVCYWGVF